jgi:peptidoglycan hydrolase CwlO-like protein
MSAVGQEDRRVEYSTSHRVQAWFLRKSRDGWKRKSKRLKTDKKRLQNRVNDVAKSRERWREQARKSAERVRELETETAALHQQLAALKKEGHVGAPGSVR